MGFIIIVPENCECRIVESRLCEPNKIYVLDEQKLLEVRDIQMAGSYIQFVGGKS